MTTITLYRANGSWMAHWTGGERTAQVLRLFGTPDLPTAFRDTAPAERVQREIQASNPDCTVEIACRPEGVTVQ